jgi:hypothetical protein
LVPLLAYVVFMLDWTMHMDCAHLLEAPLKPRVFFDGLLELVWAAAAQAAQAAACKRRLENSAAIQHGRTLQ